MRAAVAATAELGRAAESLQESLGHVGQARKKGRAITKRVGKTALRAKNAVVGAVKKTARKVTRKRTRSRKAA